MPRRRASSADRVVAGDRPTTCRCCDRSESDPAVRDTAIVTLGRTGARPQLRTLYTQLPARRASPCSRPLQREGRRRADPHRDQTRRDHAPAHRARAAPALLGDAESAKFLDREPVPPIADIHQLDIVAGCPSPPGERGEPAARRPAHRAHSRADRPRHLRRVRRSHAAQAAARRSTSSSRGQRLPARFTVIGVARSPMTDDEFRQQFHDSLKEFAGLADARRRVDRARARAWRYVQGEMDDPGALRASSRPCSTERGAARTACCSTWRSRRRSTAPSSSSSAPPV